MKDTKIYKELQQLLATIKNDNFDIVAYIRHFYPNTDFCDMIELLEYAYLPKSKSRDELNQFVKDIIINEKEIVAVYPGLGEVPPKKSELIGDILDGALYLLQ
jgi:hypothetical protein